MPNMEQPNPIQDAKANQAGKPGVADADTTATQAISPSAGAVTMPEDRGEPEKEQMTHMTIGEHLDDLRKRLFYCIGGLGVAMVIALTFAGRLIEWISIPFVDAMSKAGYKDASLVTTSVTAPFNIYLTIGFYAGLVLASPWIFYQLWMFVGAGLYSKERRYVKLAVPFSVVLFLLGAAFAVRLSIPAIEFFIMFGKDYGITPIIKIDDYIDFMTNLVLAFGAVFQMPLVVLVLARVGLVSMRTLRKYRRHVIVGISAVAAVLAPPDVGSMIAMLLPMWLLYEFGVFLSWLLIFRKREAQAKLEGQEDMPEADA